MKDLLRENISIKIISILFAVILWFIVNPLMTVHLNIPLNIINEASLKDKDISIKNKDFPRSIEVAVSGRGEMIESITPDLFEATLDLSKVKSASDNILSIDGPVYIGKDSGVTIKNVNPQNVNIQLERIINKTVNINLVSIGTPLKGYKLTNMYTNSKALTLRGTQSIINSVKSIKAIVDLSNIDRNTIVKQNIKVYDINNNEIPELSKNQTIDVNIEVAKEVPVNLLLQGKLNSNYSFVSGNVSPGKVLITGTHDVLDKVSEIETQPINLNNLNNNLIKMGKIQIPKGIKLVNLTGDVAIKIYIEKMVEKSYTLNSNSVKLTNSDLNGNLIYSIPTNSINIKLKGTNASLKNLNLNSLKPTIDVYGLKEGEQKVPLKIILPKDIKLAQNYILNIVIQKR